MSNEELVVRIKAGVDTADNMLQLWEQTKNFIRCMARRYRGYAELEDLEQEGYIALYDAVDGYSKEAGCKFLSYASFWINQRMKRYIESCCRTVRIPDHEQQKMHQYRKIENAFQIYRGRKPTRWEICYNLDLDEKQASDLESAINMSRIGSLDSILQESDNGDTIGDMIPSSVDVEGDVIDRVDQEELCIILGDMVASLPDDQKTVMRCLYGREQYTRAATGRQLCMCTQEIRRAERKALYSLRRHDRVDSLRAFLPEAAEAQAYRHNSSKEFNTTWTSSTERIAMRL